MKISDVNNLEKQNFLKLFGNIVENWPKLASELHKNIPYKNVDDMCNKIQDELDKLKMEEKELVLKLHPDLAGKLADSGQLTNESTEEQRAAGLDKISAADKNELNDLNYEYKDKFGFPFVICARENKFESILRGLRTRLNNNKNQELLTGIEEVKKISKLRLQSIVEN